MKQKLILTLLATLFCVGISQAQNAGQAFLDSAINNGAIGGGAWRSLTGNYDIISYDYLFNITTNANGLGAGLIAGGDVLRSGHNAPIQNDVKGGFAVNYLINGGAIGLTNVNLKAYAGSAIATPKDSTAGIGVGNITFAGVDWAAVTRYVDFHISPAYQTRVGQGKFDRNYFGIQAFISKGDGGVSMVSANDLYLKYAMNQE